jgi:hypothetical protein
MSSPAFQIRSGRIRAAGAPGRVSGLAGAALHRARLTVVPRTRTRTSHLPFVTLVSFVLLAGVVGLLMFNTSMQQTSFKATSLQDRVNVLTAKEQSLALELDSLRDPQHLAVAAKELGMVAPSQPAFVRLADGRVLGNPTPATVGDTVRVNPLPSKKPAALKRRTVIVKVPAATTPSTPTAAGTAAATSGTDTPGTSTTGEREGGRKKASNQADSGATR